MTEKTERSIRRLNNLLAYELGSIDGVHAALQWRWSQDLVTIIPALNANGDEIYDLFCACGKNIEIHGPHCTIQAARLRTILYPVAPNIINRWVLCRWKAPPPEQMWLEKFGSLEDYPSGGTYIPLGVNATQCVLKQGRVPDDDITWTLIYATRRAQSIQQLQEEYAVHQALNNAKAIHAPSGEIIERPAHNAPWWKTHDTVKELMPAFGQIPGTKGSTSFPTPSEIQSERKPN